MKSKFSFARFLARPSHFVPCLVVAGVAVLPAFLAGGCGSSSNSSSNNTDQFTSIGKEPVTLDVAWAIYATPTPTPTGATPTPTPTATATPTPDPSATPPYTESDTAAADTALAAPSSALSAVITLSTANPNTGSVLIFPAINRSNDLGTAYVKRYVSALEARIGNTNANVRFYDAKDGKGNPLGDYRAFGLKINDDGTGLNAGLSSTTLITPSPPATPTASPSASPSASP